MLDTASGHGVLATIYIDRVEWLAHEAGADSRALLGRAIAHELGHLLLATTTHGPAGLMRAFWSQDEVRRGQPATGRSRRPSSPRIASAISFFDFRRCRL